MRSKGTVATEDERFYDHGGVDLQGIVRAVVVNLSGGRKTGASTITQQYVRNTILSSEMNEISIKRKVREMTLAGKRWNRFIPKTRFLMMYLEHHQLRRRLLRHSGCGEALLLGECELTSLLLRPRRSSAFRVRPQCTTRSSTPTMRSIVATWCFRACSPMALSPKRNMTAAKAEDLNLNVQEETGTNGVYLYKYFTKAMCAIKFLRLPITSRSSRAVCKL